jgi:hypothetical protein
MESFILEISVLIETKALSFPMQKQTNNDVVRKLVEAEGERSAK